MMGQPLRFWKERSNLERPWRMAIAGQAEWVSGTGGEIEPRGRPQPVERPTASVLCGEVANQCEHLVGP